MKSIYLTAGSLQTMLRHMESWADKSESMMDLMVKIELTLNGKIGLQKISIHFSHEETELLREFQRCAAQLTCIFNHLANGISVN